MPKKADYERDIELPKIGQEMGGWVVEKARTTETVVERHKRYKFTTLISIRRSGGATGDGLKALRTKIKRRAKVLSPYGNEYICKMSLRYGSATADIEEVIVEGDCRR
jgi:hypothetical protein